MASIIALKCLGARTSREPLPGERPSEELKSADQGPSQPAVPAGSPQKRFSFCPKCGEKLPDLTAKFCPFCGASLVPSGGVDAEKSSETKISNDQKGEISEPKAPGKKGGTSKTLAKNVARHGWKFKVAVSVLTLVIASNTLYYFGVFRLTTTLQPAQQFMDQIWSTPVLQQVHQVLTQIFQGIQNIVGSNNQLGNSNGTSPAVGAQVWDLTNDVGQTATVIVQPFTYSGTFSETSGSTGWWCLDNVGSPCFRFSVGGNIVHSSQGDVWTFSLSGSGGGYQGMGTAEGAANGNFPNATAIYDGTCTITYHSRYGTTTGTGHWIGRRR